MKIISLFYTLLLSLIPLSAQTIVTNLDDEDDGPTSLNAPADISLREAINHSAPNTTITFDSSLDGETITLTEGELVIDRNLTIDASALPNGLTIDGGGNGDFINDNATNNETRCFFIDDRNPTPNTFQTISLANLTIQNGSHEGANAGANIHNRENLNLINCKILNGRAFGGNDDADGGGIYHRSGTLTLTDCTISGNQIQGNRAAGGGIYQAFGILTLTRCTVSDNQVQGSLVEASSGGGGIYSHTGFAGQSTTITSCTITGNAANNANGGGVYNWFGSTIIQHCTITENTSATNRGAGVSSSGNSNTQTQISDTIIRDSLQGSDLGLISGIINSFTFSGINLIGTADTEINNAPMPNTAPLLLAPLGHYGGPTHTIIPLHGSPALDMATGSTRATDQRGLPIVATADIGASEYQGAPDLQLAIPFIWGIDHDGDGNTFGVEFALGTDPFLSDPSDPANLALNFDAGGQPILEFGFNSAAVGTAIWILESSPDFTQNNWTELSRNNDPGGASSIPDPTDPRQFYRFRAKLVE